MDMNVIGRLRYLIVIVNAICIVLFLWGVEGCNSLCPPEG